MAREGARDKSKSARATRACAHEGDDGVANGPEVSPSRAAMKESRVGGKRRESGGRGGCGGASTAHKTGKRLHSRGASPPAPNDCVPVDKSGSRERATHAADDLGERDRKRVRATPRMREGISPRRGGGIRRRRGRGGKRGRRGRRGGCGGASPCRRGRC